MFLRATKRYKDGKAHHYWNLVESVHVGRRVFQRQALYLGELNDSQQTEWQQAVEPNDEVTILLDRLGLKRPAQPPPKVSSGIVETVKSGV